MERPRREPAFPMRHLGAFNVEACLLGLGRGGVMRLGDIAFGLFLRAAIVVSLLLVSFAHKPVALSAWQPFDLSAYELPDGSLPVICFGTGNGAPGGKAGRAEACEFCRIAGSIALALPCRYGNPPLVPVAVPLFPVETTHRPSLPRRLLPPSQGPPSIAI